MLSYIGTYREIQDFTDVCGVCMSKPIVKKYVSVPGTSVSCRLGVVIEGR